MYLPSGVQLTEVGPRDGLQNEPRNLPTQEKVRLITRLAAVGLDEIEVTSFVNPRVVPNLADADEVMAATRGLVKKRIALILNAKGYDRARHAGAPALTVTLSLTDSHNRHNANKTTLESVRDLKPLAAKAKADGVTARVAVSMAFGCPFEGVVELARLLALVAEMIEAGFDRIVLCDTIGIADPKQVNEWSRRCLAEFPNVQFALHLHDTYGRGLANIVAGLEAGVTSFDTAIGGLGGCPFAPGATGNVATEDVVALLERMGIATGVDLDGLVEQSIAVLAQLEQPPRSHLSQVEGPARTVRPVAQTALKPKFPGGPLHGVKVLELGTLIAGPSCTRTLAEFGAEVIKVELPREGDPIRRWRVMHECTSLWWYVQSRNKKCITLDSRTAEGVAILRKLIGQSDVLVENFRPGTLDKWGLDAEALKEINPRLVVARVSGFGQDGPYSRRPGFGAVAEAMGGLRHVTGYPDRPPVRVGISLGDSVAALYATIGILMALYARDVKGGPGQTVDVALYEAVFALMESMVTEYAHSGVIRERTGSVLPGIVPSNLYPTSDGKYLLVAGNGDAIVRRLLTAIGRSDLVGDERLSTNDVRARHMEFIDGVISSWTRTRTLDECLARLEENDVPASRIYDVTDIVRDPHYHARDMILQVDHGELGSVLVPGIVPKLSETPGAVRWLGPRLGEHNAEVFGDLGLDAAQIAELAAKGVI